MRIGIDGERAWAAGFFDGEGNAGYFKHGKSRRLIAQVVQVERQPLERFRSIVGVGTIIACKPRNKQRPYFRWSVQSISGFETVFNLLAPILCSPKRNQFYSAYAAYEEYKSGQHGRYVAAGKLNAAKRWRK